MRGALNVLAFTRQLTLRLVRTLCGVLPRLPTRGLCVDVQRDACSRLLVEPVTVPNLEHTGVAPNFVAKEAPLFYPNGLRNCNLRETIRVSLRTADPESGEPAGIRSPSRSPTRARVSAGAGAGSDVVGAGGGASGGAAAGGRSVSRGKRKPHGRSGVRVRPDAKAGPPRATGRPRQSTMELAKHTQPRRRDTGARRPSAASAHTAGSRASVTSDRAALKKRPVDRSTMDLLKEMNAQNERMARTLERC